MEIEDLRNSTKILKFENLDYGDIFTQYDTDEIYYMKIYDTFVFDGSYVNAINLYNCELVIISIETLVKVVKAKLVIED